MSGFLANASGGGNYNSGFGGGSTFRGTKEFFQSNSMIAKVAFLIMVVVLFVVCLRLGSAFITWLFSPSKNPKIVDGMKNAKLIKHIPANPGTDNAIPILRSNNERDGIEFTWSVWLYIDDLEYNKGKLKHIFHKGDDTVVSQNTEISSTATCPALYLHQNKNALVIFMNTFGSMNEQVEIDDIPLNKWINIAIRLEGRTMDVFINGKIATRHIFRAVPMQNYGDTYVNANGGYSGMISDLWYHNKALTGVEIMNIVRGGPSLAAQDDIKIFPPYFSLKWYFQTKTN